MPRASLTADLHLGHTIRTARKRLGVLQPEVAHAVGISVRTLRYYESGEQSVPVGCRLLLARALRLSPADLGVVEPVEPAPPEPPPPSLAPDEAAWLALYHRLPSWVRALFRRRVPEAVTPAQEPASC
ncbi:MAG: helix-turn-helix transcriptional regulator [Methylorubrum rhodinum]|uniref:helix-turn-helix transcriptional regulator n=1 Tax=Methylorubrum rhodinum TaxID=29428 RepID=UPI003BAECE32